MCRSSLPRRRRDLQVQDHRGALFQMDLNGALEEAAAETGGSDHRIVAFKRQDVVIAGAEVADFEAAVARDRKSPESFGREIVIGVDDGDRRAFSRLYRAANDGSHRACT